MDDREPQDALTEPSVSVEAAWEALHREMYGDVTQTQRVIDHYRPAIEAALRASVTPLDPFVLGMAMDMTDEEDAVLGVVGRGTKAERVAARYARLSEAHDD